MPALPIPDPRIRVAQRLNATTASPTFGLGGSAMNNSTGGTVVTSTTYSEVIACPASARIRVRILTATATGTLTVSPVAPIAASPIDESVMAPSGWVDPSKVTAYGTGTGSVAVSAGTEANVDLDLYGENWVLISFDCTLDGSLVWVDVCQL